MVCTGWGLVLAGRALAVRMSLEILVTTWRPDRSHVFGPRRLPEVSVSVEMPAQQLLREGLPAPRVLRSGLDP